MSEKFNLMNNERILRDDHCISLAGALRSAKKCLGPERVTVKINNFEVSSLVPTSIGNSLRFEMQPGKITVADLRFMNMDRKRRLQYNDESNHSKNIKKAAVIDGRLVLYV